MSIWITATNHISDFKIWLRFNDDKEGIIDLQRTLFTDSRPFFALLRNPEYFRRFKVEMDGGVAEVMVWYFPIEYNEFRNKRIDSPLRIRLFLNSLYSW